METTITVTKEHLDRARKARHENDRPITTCCLLSQAVRDVIKAEAQVSTAPGSIMLTFEKNIRALIDGARGELTEVAVANEDFSAAMMAFDVRHYALAESYLPFTFNAAIPAEFLR